jgi:hypothetical protein
MRTLTIHEYVLEELNKMLAKDGVRIVSERPKPTLITDNVVKLERKDDQSSLEQKHR